MRAEHDGAARLEGNEDLVDGCRCRIRRWNDGRYDAERFGDFDDAPILVASDDADGLHRPDEPIDLL